MDYDDLERLKNYVRRKCKDRDSSHDYSHMKTVYENAMKIMKETDNFKYTRDIKRWVTIVAWLHDVNDHKYVDADDKRAEKSLKNMIKSLDVHRYEELYDCIKFISFSRELRLGKGYYNKYLKDDMILVRNIVSDADKIEQLGLKGIDRIVDFHTQKLKETFDSEKLALKFAYDYMTHKLVLIPYVVHFDYTRILCIQKYIEMSNEFRKHGFNEFDISRGF